jgi:hypothetical protein
VSDRGGGGGGTFADDARMAGLCVTGSVHQHSTMSVTHGCMVCAARQVLTDFPTLSNIWQPSTMAGKLHKGAASGAGAGSAIQRARLLLQVLLRRQGLPVAFCLSIMSSWCLLAVHGTM